MLGLIGKTVGPYHILEQIGQGGMSSVFKAIDLRDRRPVALKILSPYIAHEQHFRARFEREVKLLRQLSHPNIVPILDFGEAEGLAYIVMPYIGTGTLQDRLQSGPLDVRAGASVTSQIAAALTLAHSMGVVHRDVKPSNVLLDSDGNALLSDFSFAHSQNASQNLTGSALIGTPAYMSPEQCRGEAIDARSDQYSFAIMLYQLCTGKLPFEGDTPMAVALKHVNEPLPRPRLVNPNLPDGVDAVLVRALAKDRNLRFASVAELNQEFQKAVDDALTTGVRKVRTPLFDRSTQIYEKYQRVPSKQLPWYQRRSAAVAVVALALIGCPLSAWGMSALLPGLEGASANGRPTVMVVTPEGMGATVLAMMTELAPPPGTLIPRETMNAAIAATFAAAGITYVPPTDLPTATPTATNTFGPFFPSPTPTPTRTLRPGETPPTSTRTPTATQGPSPTPQPPTETTAPSDTSEPPTDTSVPPTNTPQPPTNTPLPPTPTYTSPASSECGPIPPGQCHKTQTAAARTAAAAPVDTPTP
ncbi:MAG TPA: serine/threonine-protein kinase [Anaerolineales bacterium]|nr:serine/threonine-protein kinase [Anaerolineales bacterium]